MKKLKVILTVMVCIILTGCNTSYIDNKKVASTLFNELKECLGEDCIEEVLSEEELEEILKIIA